MGLDGLSIKNLALNRDNTSKENAINADIIANSNTLHSKNIDQLDKKHALTAEDHDNPNFSGGSTGDDDEVIEDIYEDAQDNDGDEELFYEDYVFKINGDENVIHIIDGKTKQVVIDITPEDLSKFVANMKQASGIIVNKKV